MPPEVANGYLAAMLAELAEGVHLHQCHLVRQYRRLTGMTPMDFVRRRRIERAIGLLLNNTRSDPRDVARRIGISDTLRLKRLIKRYTGLSVRELRSQHRNGRPTPSSPVPFLL